MKRLVLGILSIMIIGNVLFAGEKVPEFDGGYVKLVNGKFIEMDSVKAYKTQITRGTMGIRAILSLPQTYYTISKKSMIPVDGNNFKGIAIRGNYKFKNFSLHPLRSKKLEKNEGLFENHGPATKASTLYTNGKTIKIRSKSLGNNTYYFAPKDKLPKGEYVAWLGLVFWLFEVK